MSLRHPIIAVTGSSGAGTSTVKLAFEHIFRRMELNAAFVHGDGFHSYNRAAMAEELNKANIRGENFSHFGPAANHFDKLASLFNDYGENATGEYRHYVHDEIEAAEFGAEPGHFTEWEPVKEDTDLLFYEGLHGGVVTEKHNIASHVDLLVGVTPIINLEWIQKRVRDQEERGYSAEEVKGVVMRRMYDYVNYITPQFSTTDINFQRVPTVDTSNPFTARDIPSNDESMVVIRFRKSAEHKADFPYLLRMIAGSFMSRPNTLVIPGGKMGFAMELIFTPILEDLVVRRNAAREAAAHNGDQLNIWKS